MMSKKPNSFIKRKIEVRGTLLNALNSLNLIKHIKQIKHLPHGIYSEKGGFQ